MTNTNDPTRRRFLEILGAGAVIAVACGSKDTAPEATGDIPAGNVGGVSLGTLTVVAGHPLVIARDGGGVYAMSTICTHAQCDMRENGSVTKSGMSCSCHGSTFDAEGNPTGGPAPSPVKHFAVEIANDGAITIHAGTSVSVATRVPVSGG